MEIRDPLSRRISLILVPARPIMHPLSFISMISSWPRAKVERKAERTPYPLG